MAVAIRQRQPAVEPFRTLPEARPVLLPPTIPPSAEVEERQRAVRDGQAQDRRIVRLTLAFVLLGVPIGAVLGAAFVAAIVAAIGSFTPGAPVAGALAGALWGAFLGGTVGLGVAMRREGERRPALRWT